MRRQREEFDGRCQSSACYADPQMDTLAARYQRRRACQRAGRLPAETSQRPFLILRADLEAYARGRNPSQKAAPGPKAFPNLPHPDVFKSKGPYSEPHASAPQLASLWGVSDDFIRDLFANEPSVLRVSRPAGVRNRTDGTAKREYTTFRIPESVVRRVHARLSGKKPLCEAEGERDSRATRQ